MINIDLNLNTQTPFLQNGSRLSLLVNIHKILADHKVYDVIDLIYNFYPYYKTPKAIRVFVEAFMNYISDSIPDNIGKRSSVYNDLTSELELLQELTFLGDAQPIYDRVALYKSVVHILKERFSDRFICSSSDMLDSLVIFIYKTIVNKEITYFLNMIKDKELRDKLYSLSGTLDG